MTEKSSFMTCVVCEEGFVPYRSTQRYCSQPCRQIAQRKTRDRWIAANPEKDRESKARWDRENSEKKKQTQRRLRQKNPEKYRAIEKKWRLANPEKVRRAKRESAAKNRDTQRRWYEANREHMIELQRRRYAENPEYFRAYSLDWYNRMVAINPHYVRDLQRNQKRKRLQQEEGAA